MNRIKEQAFIVANKETGKLAEWCEVVSTERNAKTRYSYCRQKGSQFADQTENVVIQLINPIKLHQMLDDMKGGCTDPDDLIDIIKAQIDAQ
jgi:DNA-binding TFAR19-related protein (PDSD5 family)